jgi:hypothetical protein
MPFEDRARESALQRRETKAVFAVVLQDEPHKAVAETADAVVEDYRMVQSKKILTAEFAEQSGQKDFNRRVRGAVGAESF